MGEIVKTPTVKFWSTLILTMSYYQCHNCMKIVHFDADNLNNCPVCGSENGEILTDEEHKKAVEEGYLFHDDTD